MVNFVPKLPSVPSPLLKHAALSVIASVTRKLAKAEDLGSSNSYKRVLGAGLSNVLW